MSLKTEKMLNILSKVIFSLYIILIIWVVVFKCNLLDNITKTHEYLSTMSLAERFKMYLKPFNDYFEGPFVSQRRTIFFDDLLNVVIFMPMGLYLSYFIKKQKFLKTLVLSLCISIIFEVFQLFSLIGSFSTKDLITNTFGGIIGYLGYLLIYKKNNSTIRLTILNILSLIVIIIIMPIVIYAIINTIKNMGFYLDLMSI